jgi:hypothetical protein
MRRRIQPSVHPMACTCRKCAPAALGPTRTAQLVKAATRVLFLVAAMIAIPFIVAHALACARDGRA